MAFRNLTPKQLGYFFQNWSNARYPDSKVHEAYIGPTWGRQDPGGTHAGPMNPAIRVYLVSTPVSSHSEEYQSMFFQMIMG